MTGPEHYREAQRLLEAAYTHWSDRWDTNQLAAAQVHATLAAAAAAAVNALTVAYPSCAQWTEPWSGIAAPTGPEVTR